MGNVDTVIDIVAIITNLIHDGTRYYKHFFIIQVIHAQSFKDNLFRNDLDWQT